MDFGNNFCPLKNLYHLTLLRTLFGTCLEFLLLEKKQVFSRAFEVVGVRDSCVGGNEGVESQSKSRGDEWM